jgi:hypothetical protein
VIEELGLAMAVVVLMVDVVGELEVELDAKVEVRLMIVVDC